MALASHLDMETAAGGDVTCEQCRTRCEVKMTRFLLCKSGQRELQRMWSRGSKLEFWQSPISA